MHQHVLADQIVMRQGRRLRQPGSARTIEPRRCRPLTDTLIIKPHPILLTALHQLLPAPKPLRHALLQHIENPDVGLRDGAGVSSGEDRRQHFRLGDEISGLGGADVVHELEGRVGGVGAGEDAARGDDAEEEHGVLDVVEGVQAHAVAGLEAGGVEARDEFSDDGAGLPARDGARGVGGVDVDLGNALIRGRALSGSSS
jgi:hypothetical protein